MKWLRRRRLRRLRPHGESLEGAVEDSQQLLPHRVQDCAGHARGRLPGEDGAVCSAEDGRALCCDSTSPGLQEFSQQPAAEAGSLADPDRHRTRLRKRDRDGASEFDSMDGRNALTGSRLAIGVGSPQTLTICSCRSTAERMLINAASA